MNIIELVNPVKTIRIEEQSVLEEIAEKHKKNQL